MQTFGADAYNEFMSDVDSNTAAAARTTVGVDEEIRAMNLALWGNDEDTQAYVHDNFNVPTSYFNKLEIDKEDENLKWVYI